MGVKKFFKAFLYMFSRFSLTTKIIWIIAILVLVAAFISRNALVRSQGSSERDDAALQGPIEGVALQSPLDKEALDIAKASVFDKTVVKCGDLAYMKSFWNAVGDRWYRRFREGKINIYSQPLSEADRLNGVEWRGNVSFDSIGPYQVADQYNGYGEWLDTAMGTSVSCGLEKKNGKWEIVGGNNPSFYPLTCEEALNPTKPWPSVPPPPPPPPSLAKATTPTEILGQYNCVNYFRDMGGVKPIANGTAVLTDVDVSYLHIYPREEPYQVKVVFTFYNIKSVSKIDAGTFAVRFDLKQEIWARPGDSISEINFADMDTRDNFFNRFLEAKAAWDRKYPELR